MQPEDEATFRSARSNERCGLWLITVLLPMTAPSCMEDARWVFGDPPTCNQGECAAPLVTHCIQGCVG